MITKYHKLIIVFIILFMAIVSFSLAWTDSLTFDEVAHIPAGYSYAAKHDYRLNPEHPPLLKALSGIAILPLQPNFDWSADFWTTANNYGEYGQWAAGRHLLHQANNNVDLIVFWARVPVVIISILFGLFLFMWGKKLGGIITGLFAFILYAFDPNILGHNHFVTTDIAIAAAIGVAFYFFLQFIKKPTWTNALFGGLALGLAQVTKFSAIILLPLFALILITYPIIKYYKRDESRWKTLGLYLTKGIFSIVIMFFTVWLVYLPVSYKMPPDVLPPITEIKSQPEKYARDKYLTNFIYAANNYTITRPLAAYTQGLMQVLSRVNDGNVTFFLGNVSSEASTIYFPFVFIAKQTLLHLFFYCIALTLIAITFVRGGFNLFTQKLQTSLIQFRKFILNRFHEIVLGIFILFYSYLSITGNLNIGFRHLFPMMPLIYILTAKIIIDSYKNLRNPIRKNIIRNIFIALIITLIATVISVYPYYMSYFNVLFGGPTNGWHYVTDSNADWGQDLKRLKIYLDNHPEIDKVRISYFGGDDIHNRLGEDKYILWWDSKRPIEPGYYALSTFFIQESIYDKNKSYDDSYRWLADYEPIDQVGTSFLIYKID
ncbi:MAG: ArnT family glycosyltransferase [Candidatus Moraniibacteriota bacterium]|jgi:4-amino-4-deoxy-L-arabinose transferase-like glycosyltransferase